MQVTPAVEAVPGTCEADDRSTKANADRGDNGSTASHDTLQSPRRKPLMPPNHTTDVHKKVA